MSALCAVSAVLESLETPYALIGARAVGARGHPRMTLDYDFLSGDPRILDPDTWKDVARGGATVDPRKGDDDDPVAGVVHLRFASGVEADVLLARWDWELEVIKRSERLQIGDTIVPVPLTSDLILLKLVAGGPIDLQDVIALLATDRERLLAEVDAKVDRVHPDVTAVWNRVKA